MDAIVIFGLCFAFVVLVAVPLLEMFENRGGDRAN
jgi:hypothetical protein